MGYFQAGTEILSDQYIYVDVAIGGVNRRNNVRKSGSVIAEGLGDAYVSHNRATDALLTWVQTHKNKNGRPTVEGFDGETWTDNLHLDFDAEGNVEQALRSLRQVLDKLELWGVDLRAVRAYFSGSKGFHLEIPSSLLGGFAPSKDLHRRLQRAAKAILGEIPFDTSVYDKLRLWRVENSRHSKTNLYKIRLTPTEAQTATIEQIRALAASPRDTSAVPELAAIADDDWLAVDELVELWGMTATAEAVDEQADQPAPTNGARALHTKAAIVASWPHGGVNAVEGASSKVSRHADYLMPIIGALLRRTSAAHVTTILLEAAELAADQSFLQGRDWKSEIERLVASSHARIRTSAGDEHVKGLRALGRNFPALANILAVLWPAPTLNLEDDDEEDGPDIEQPTVWKPADPKPPTGSDGAETCLRCVELEQTVEALREQAETYRAEHQLLIAGPVPAQEGAFWSHLVKRAALARAHGEERVKLYLPNDCEGANVSRASATRALNKLRAADSASLPFAVATTHRGGKTHLAIVVPPTINGDPWSEQRAYLALARTRLAEERAKVGGSAAAVEARWRCPDHPDETVVETINRHYRCADDDCDQEWIAPTERVHHHRKAPEIQIETQAASTIHGPPFVTEVSSTDSDERSGVGIQNEAPLSKDVGPQFESHSARTISFTSWQDMEAASHWRPDPPPDDGQGALFDLADAGDVPGVFR